MGRQTQGLDMDQAFNTLLDLPGFSELETVLTIPKPCLQLEPAAGQVGRSTELFPFPSSDLCCGRGVSQDITNHLFTEICVV